MRPYIALRDWVDRSWAGSNFRRIVLPVPILFLVALWLENEAITAASWVAFGLWTSFCAWRWWLQMRIALGGGDAFGVRNRKKNSKKNG